MAASTHEFKFDVNGVFIRGELYYDTLNQPILTKVTISDPIPLATIKRMVTVLEGARDVYVSEAKALDKIIIKKLGVI